jgi:(1->4)-alpha-D-glucan 1-alpha-D-glucosylmutase
VRPRVPTATYRLQVQAAFGFATSAALAGYLADLGVSHAYLSPVLQAAPGSTHGYDVLDHSRLSDEAGGRAASTRWSRRCTSAASASSSTSSRTT